MNFLRLGIKPPSASSVLLKDVIYVNGAADESAADFAKKLLLLFTRASRRGLEFDSLLPRA